MSRTLCFCRGVALAQRDLIDDRPRPAAESGGPGGPGGETLRAINEDYNRQLLQLERQRLERLARLAASQPPQEAAGTYETLFRLAIANNLFAEADAVADQVLKSPNPSPPVVRFLAETINLIAAADRGAVRRVAGRPPPARRRGRSDGQAAAPAASLDTPVAADPLRGLLSTARPGRPVRRGPQGLPTARARGRQSRRQGVLRHRLRQLNLIGKPAPPIQGTDVNGKPVDLARLKGDVVLVVFWATWCLPNAAEIAWLDQVYEANRGRGLPHRGHQPRHPPERRDPARGRHAQRPAVPPGPQRPLAQPDQRHGPA